MSVTKLVEFSSAHSVKDEPLHGHNYKLAVTVSGPIGPDNMVLDFRDLKAVIQEVTSQLDHRNLNELMNEPTAEAIALWVWRRLEGLIESRGQGLKLEKIALWENDRSWVEVRRDEP